jgi:hypothetical protein
MTMTDSGPARKVADVLTDGQGVTITHAAVDLGFPGERLPARVDEVLTWLVSSYVFTTDIALFYKDHGPELPDDLYPLYAAVALLAQGKRLDVEPVTALVRRARAADAPYDPVRDLATVVAGMRRMGGPFSPAVSMAMANLKRAGVVGTRDETEARIRALLEAR